MESNAWEEAAMIIGGILVLSLLGCVYVYITSDDKVFKEDLLILIAVFVGALFFILTKYILRLQDTLLRLQDKLRRMEERGADEDDDEVQF